VGNEDNAYFSFNPTEFHDLLSFSVSNEEVASSSSKT
jgi:hypothetical protein